jgi:peptidoglycan hydrolase-like protein with peptidoglycan-binding domain
MRAAQQNAIVELLEYLYEKYGKLQVNGHRDFGASACPGKNYPFAQIVNGKKADIHPKPDVKPSVDPNALTVVLTTLGKGDEGEQVKALQYLLAGFGYDLGGFGADGIFGDATDRDVRAFQQGEGLAVDGLVGYDTWSHLLGIV